MPGTERDLAARRVPPHTLVTPWGHISKNRLAMDPSVVPEYVRHRTAPALAGGVEIATALAGRHALFGFRRGWRRVLLAARRLVHKAPP